MIGPTLNDLMSITGAAVVIAVVVNICKRWIADDFVPLFSVGVGMVLVVLASLALGNWGAEAVGNALLTGFLAGAAAVGLYDLQKPLRVLTSKDNPN